jgi:hypothetical protein
MSNQPIPNTVAALRTHSALWKTKAKDMKEIESSIPHITDQNHAQWLATFGASLEKLQEDENKTLSISQMVDQKKATLGPDKTRMKRLTASSNAARDENVKEKLKKLDTVAGSDLVLKMVSEVFNVRILDTATQDTRTPNTGTLAKPLPTLPYLASKHPASPSVATADRLTVQTGQTPMWSRRTSSKDGRRQHLEYPSSRPRCKA